MARIRSVDTQPELILRRALHQAGLRYRLQVRTPGGKADLVIPSRKFALFIDGCFWHGCPEHYVHPRSNPEFWDKKLRENVDRDRRQTLALSEEGWTVLRVWEHQVLEAPLKVVELVKKRLASRRRIHGGWRVVRVRASEGTSEFRWQEDLLDPTKCHEVVRERTTAKTGRVRGGVVRKMSVVVAREAGEGEVHDRKSGRDGEA